MKELAINTGVEGLTVQACSGNLTLDTFLNSQLDGTMGRKRTAVIRALLASYVQSAPEFLDALFERAYDYGKEIDRLSLSPELRNKIVLSAQESIPAGIVKESPDGKVFFPQKPIAQLMDGNRDCPQHDWPSIACLLGIASGILSLQNFTGLVPADTLPALNSNPISEFLSIGSALLEQLIARPQGLIDSLLPKINSREQYHICCFVTKNLLSEFVDGRINKLIQAKRKSMVSYNQDGGSKKYSRWAVLWENPQSDLVRKLFPEIPPEDKGQFYARASVLAQFQLTRDVLKRDIENGSVPADIMRFVDEYLLSCLNYPDQTNIDLNGLEKFIKTQTALLQQSPELSSNQFETVADYRDTALKLDFVKIETERGKSIGGSSLLDRQTIGQATAVELGIRTLEFLPDYQVEYPQNVVDALGILFGEYNLAFAPLIKANREWPTDYQYAIDNFGRPLNLMIQVDMVGLYYKYLTKTQGMDPQVIAENLRSRIFEMENSIADYRYLQAVGVNIRPVLDSIRKRYQHPIALLATTVSKYQEMRLAEFSQPREGEMIDSGRVKSSSGFDVFWGPDEFQRYLDKNNGQCNYLLYVRSSAPVSQLRHPLIRGPQPLLLDPQLRRVIKANAITFNIDNPGAPLGDASRINDTKLYMPQIGMGYPVYCITDLKTEQFGDFLRNIGNENPILRAKPALGTYGGYGQIRGSMDTQFIRALNSAMKMRGPYILQAEKPYSRIISDQGIEYMYIDRNYLGWVDEQVTYLGGERTLMPVTSQEARSGRIHANAEAILANIRIQS